MTKYSFLCVLLALVASIADVTALVAQAPKVTVSAYEEVIPTLRCSKLVYNFADVIKEARERKVPLEVPDNFPLKDLSRFEDESIDFRECNNGSGLSFAQLYALLDRNIDEIVDGCDDGQGLELIDVFKQIPAHTMDRTYLATYRSIEQEVACVYGVVKDECNKRVIVSFRGSQQPFQNRDWKTNLNAQMVNLRTPKKIKDKMEGAVKDGVLVHKGFYNYLFDNKFDDGQQKYDQICTDIQPLMEEGYSLYVTGHSLGGALATMFSFKLAGAGKKRDWVPRPLTCITYAGPPSGSASYRAAFEQEEIDGLVRCLRINNGEDIVPALPPFSLGAIKRGMKHTGIHCRLYNGGVKLAHTSQDGLINNISNVIGNSIFKPVWKVLTWHGLPLHEVRLEDAKSRLSAQTIDELYKDESVVGRDFLNGKVCHYECNEAGEQDL